MYDWWIYLVVCIGSLFAGFMDAVVGGGGLIQVPLLLILFPQLSHVQIIASNRFASVAGTAVAAYQYFISLQMDMLIVLVTGATSAIAAFSGTFVMQLISPDVFKPLLLLIIIVLAIFTFAKKDLGIQHQPKYTGSKQLFICAGIGTLLGFYNGFIGPGTGTLLVFSFAAIAGMGFINASGYAKLINVIADVASLIGFLIKGVVVFKIAIPMMACNMLGGYIGSKAAIKKGNEFIRYVFLVTVLLLILRLGYDVLRNYF